MQSKELSRIINSATKEATNAKGALSRVFRQIMADIGMTHQYWGQLMKRYVEDPRNRVRQNSRDMSSARGNLAKELIRDDMTWAVFLKGMRFLNPRWVKLKIEICWGTGKIRNYDIVVHATETPSEEPTATQAVSPTLDASVQELRDVIKEIQDKVQ